MTLSTQVARLSSGAKRIRLLHSDPPAQLRTCASAMKVQALRAHESQLGAFDDWEEMVRGRAKEHGAPAGMEYAECFTTFTLRTPDESDD